MRQIKFEEIGKFSAILSNWKLDDSFGGTLFFPIDFGENVSEDENGLSFIGTKVEMTTGGNSLFTYGLVPDRNEAYIAAAVYDKSAMIIPDMDKTVAVLSLINPHHEEAFKVLKALKDIECRVIRKNAIQFALK